MSQADDPRFVVLYHQPGPGFLRSCEPHFDWMFQFGSELRTWSTIPFELGLADQTIEVECEPLPAHRREYLDFEGEVSGDRGTVSRQLVGTFRVTETDRDSFRAVLRWADRGRSCQGVIEIYCSFFTTDSDRVDESRESWRLRFSVGRYETN